VASGAGVDFGFGFLFGSVQTPPTQPPVNDGFSVSVSVSFGGDDGVGVGVGVGFFGRVQTPPTHPPVKVGFSVSVDVSVDDSVDVFVSGSVDVFVSGAVLGFLGRVQTPPTHPPVNSGVGVGVGAGVDVGDGDGDDDGNGDGEVMLWTAHCILLPSHHALYTRSSIGFKYSWITITPSFDSGIVCTLASFSCCKRDAKARKLSAFSTISIPIPKPAAFGFTNSGQLHPLSTSDCTPFAHSAAKSPCEQSLTIHDRGASRPHRAMS